MATLSDGATMMLSSADVVLLASLNVSVASVSSGRVVAVGRGHGAYISVIWQSSCNGAHSTLGSTRAVVDFQLSAPKAVLVNVARVLTAAGASNPLAAEPLVPVSSAISVKLVFDNTQIDYTTDPRTIYDDSASGGLFSVQYLKGVPTVVPNTKGHVGTGYLIVRFNSTSLFYNASIQVIALKSVNAYGNPWPWYNGASSTHVTTLSPIAKTGVYEELRMQLVLVATNGATFNVTLSSLTEFHIASGQNLVDLAGGILSVRADAVSVAAHVTIIGSYDNADSAPLSILISLTPVYVKSFLPIVFPQTLHGIKDVAFAYANVGVVFTDGTQYVSLFSQGVTPLPGLVVFSVDNTDVVSVNANSGRVLLKDNDNKAVKLSVAAVSSSATGSTTFFANLDPDVGDVDLGAALGAPVSDVTAGQSISIPVRVNTGSTKLGAIDLTVSYDPSLLKVVDVVAGSDWPGGQFLSTLNSPPVTILLGGIPTTVIASRAYQLYTIHFTALKTAAV